MTSYEHISMQLVSGILLIIMIDRCCVVSERSSNLYVYMYEDTLHTMNTMHIQLNRSTIIRKLSILYAKH
jgi:hypothetical protein